MFDAHQIIPGTILHRSHMTMNLTVAECPAWIIA
jgi:hypothetical protein